MLDVLCDPNRGGAILADEMGLGKSGIEIYFACVCVKVTYNELF